jgi:hypothetical protein
MQVALTRWSDGKVGLSIGLGKDELSVLVSRLQELINNPEQHFHIAHIGSAVSDVGDIEVYVKESEAQDNMRISGHALGKGQYVPPK